MNGRPAFSKWLHPSLWFILLTCLNLAACPWCTNNPVAKPTIFEGDPDPGGKFFGKVPPTAKVRRYFIAAEPTLWNFIPSGEDPVKKAVIPPHIQERPTGSKLRYIQYTDESFTTRAFATARNGIMGPVLRGVTGDYLVVTFYNRTSRPLSMHPHGVKYDKDSEGASYFPSRGQGAAIGPNAKFTYVWKIDEQTAPQKHEPSSKAWLYHSHVLGDEEINMGLVGFIIATDAARARPDGTPRDVDRELPALFTIYNESGLSEEGEYANAPPPKVPNAERPRGSGVFEPTPPKPKTWSERGELAELGARHTINGFAFGNTPGLEMIEGERVRWYLFALGSEMDLHTAHWHAARVMDESGKFTDLIEMLPGAMRTVDHLADNPGEWLLHCHVGDHMMEGMYASFKIAPSSSKDQISIQPALFPGAGQASSIRLTSMESRRNGGEEKQVLRGFFTIYNRMTLRVTRMSVMLGKKRVDFQLNNAGAAAKDGVQFKTLNVGAHGVMSGNILEFELEIPSSWVAQDKTSPLVLMVDKAMHRIPLSSKK